MGECLRDATEELRPLAPAVFALNAAHGNAISLPSTSRLSLCFAKKARISYETFSCTFPCRFRCFVCSAVSCCFFAPSLVQLRAAAFSLRFFREKLKTISMKKAKTGFALFQYFFSSRRLKLRAKKIRQIELEKQ